LSQPQHSRLELAVTSLPGLVGIGVGLIYAIGAVQIAGQASAAGYSALEILPVVPLDAVLARGVAFGLPLVGFIVVMLMIAALVPIAASWETKSSLVRRIVASLRRNTSEQILVTAGCAAIVLLGVFFAVFAFAFLLMLAAICIVYVRLEQLGWDVAGRSVISGIAGLLTIAVVGSYLAARPYPECNVTLGSGRHLTGRLITQTDGVLVIEGKNGLVSVPLRSVQQVHMGNIPGNAPEPLVSIFF